MALREAELQGIHTFCLTVDPAGHDYLREMCPERQYLVIDDVASLPRELPKVYRGLTTYGIGEFGGDMPMIVVSGVFEVEASDREAAVAAAVRMTATRTEVGCQSYAFYADFEDSNHIRVFEEWESGEALELHFRTPHMAEFRAALGKIRIKRGRVFRYEVTARAPLA